MSRWSDLVGALETLVRAATTTPTSLGSGAAGWERGIVPGSAILAFPHVCADVVVEDEQTLVGQQQRATTRILLHLWTRGETLDQIETRVGSIETALLANTTLGGLVRGTAIVSKGISDATSTGDALRCAVLILEAWKVL